MGRLSRAGRTGNPQGSRQDCHSSSDNSLQMPNHRLYSFCAQTASSLLICEASDRLPCLVLWIKRLSLGCSDIVLWTAVIYLSRLRRMLGPNSRGLADTPHRLFLAAMILSAKFLTDKPIKNSTWYLPTHLPPLVINSLFSIGPESTAFFVWKTSI